MFTLREIAAVTGGKLISDYDHIQVTGISCDSRSLKAGDLFIPLKGDRFDGHVFLKDVLGKGACAALSDHSVSFPDLPIIVVPNTLKALQQLAQQYKKRFPIPTIAVTGSAGKTTTKECIGRALSNQFKVKVGLGNFNNHIGVPLNVFQLDARDECAIFELGANHAGEIKLLAEIVQPSIGVITGIHPVHLEGFGSLQRIYDAKLELADYVEKQQGAMIASGDDPALIKRLKNRRFQLITFGASSGCDYQISNLRSGEDHIEFDVNGKYHFSLKGYGSFNAVNALAAVAVAGHLKMNLETLSKSWAELPLIENRFAIHHWPSQNLLVVDDSYNANPKSFEQAIESFKEMAKDRRKIIVVGDMLELGEQARSYHEELGRFLAAQKLDILIAVGSLSRFVLNEFRIINSHAVTAHFENMEDARFYLASNMKEGDAILIKGSHGMELYKIKPYLEERFNISSASV